MAKHKNSSRERWLKEAKKVVIKKGVEGVNIDQLSKKLGVAKTSFYHFFNSKSDFLNLLFETGIQIGIDLVIKEIYSVEDPSERIDKLIEIVLGKILDNELFLRQVRTYGLYHKKTAELICDIEQRRMAFLKGLLMDTGISETDASEKAHFFQNYVLGLYERTYADPDILKDKPKIYDRLHKLLDCIGQ